MRDHIQKRDKRALTQLHSLCHRNTSQCCSVPLHMWCSPAFLRQGLQDPVDAHEQRCYSYRATLKQPMIATSQSIRKLAVFMELALGFYRPQCVAHIVYFRPQAPFQTLHSRRFTAIW